MIDVPASGDLSRLLAQTVTIVFCDRSTGLIRGHATSTIENLTRQEVRPNETVVRVTRTPNLHVDKFCNPATGEMSEQPFPGAAPVQQQG